MRAAVQTVVFCFGMAAAPVQAQSVKDLQRKLEDSLLNQEVCLRNLSAQSPVNAHWDGNKVVLDRPFVHMLAAIFVKSVRVNSKQVEIDGVLQQLLNEPVKGWVPAGAGSTTAIVVDLNGGDSAAILPVLRDELFFGSVQDAVAAVPEDLIGAPPVFDAHKGKAPPPDPTLPTCDCADADLEGCKKDNRRVLGKTPPKLLKSVDPNFSEEARSAKVSRSSTIRLKMNASGEPIYLWVANAAGYGLDENAAIAVGQYQFQPATCHGQPVAADLYIVVNFKRF